MSKTVAYCRTSTSSQDLGIEVQLKAVEHFNPEKYLKSRFQGEKKIVKS